MLIAISGKTAYTPVAVGLTTPVYAGQTGYYTQIGKLVFCWGLLSITSWAGQTGKIQISLPVTMDAVMAALGTCSYYRAGASTNDGTNLAVKFDTTHFTMLDVTGGATCDWEGTAAVIFEWALIYAAA